MSDSNSRERELQNLRKNTKEDIANLITKALLSSIPWIGGATSEITNFFWNPFEQRLKRLIEIIADDVNKLRKEVNEFKKLPTQDEFDTTLMYVIPVAVRNHQEEKLKALRTVLLNSQLENDLDFDVRFMFIRLVDEFTPTHLTLLDFIDNPREWFEKKDIKLDRDMEKHRGGSASVDWDGMSVEGRKFLQNIFPDVEEKFEFYNQVLQDLMNKGLVELVIGFKISLLDLHNSVFQTTQLGIDFKKFVLTPPIELDKLHDSAGKGEL